jgi:hypothetical protein
MTTLNLNNDNVFEESLTVDEIRADTEELHDKVYGWLDNAQAPVFGDEQKTVYLVIEITK